MKEYRYGIAGRIKMQTGATGLGINFRRAALFAFFTAELILYVLFLKIDIWGGRGLTSARLKYAGILLCLLCAAIRALRLKNRTSYLVAAAMVFTVISDYFLLLKDIYLPGVICFCITQTLYMTVILRASGAVLPDGGKTAENCKLRRGRENDGTERAGLRRGINLFLAGLVPAAAVAVILALTGGINDPEMLLLIAAGTFYACSFIRNIIMSVTLCIKKAKMHRMQREKDRIHDIFENAVTEDRTELRQVLFAAGLMVFALCDINVLLYNLPTLFNIRSHFVLTLFEFAGTMMWAFYLPSQVMITMSPKK